MRCWILMGFCLTGENHMKCQATQFDRGSESAGARGAWRVSVSADGGWCSRKDAISRHFRWILYHSKSEDFAGEIRLDEVPVYL
jgi:hypothetical protein